MNRRDFIKKAALLGGVLMGGLATTRALAKQAPKELYRGEIGQIYGCKVLRSHDSAHTWMGTKHGWISDKQVWESLYPGPHFRQLGQNRTISKGYGQTVKIPRWEKPLTATEILERRRQGPLLAKDVAKVAGEMREWKSSREDFVAPIHQQRWLFAPGAFYVDKLGEGKLS